MRGGCPWECCDEVCCEALCSCVLGVCCWLRWMMRRLAWTLCVARWSWPSHDARGLRAVAACPLWRVEATAGVGKTLPFTRFSTAVSKRQSDRQMTAEMRLEMQNKQIPTERLRREKNTKHQFSAVSPDKVGERDFSEPSA